MNAPKVKLMELREYVSERTGDTYFSGYLGKAKVMVFRDKRAECTGREKARWSVLLEEAEPRESGGQDRSVGQRSGHERAASPPTKKAGNRAASPKQTAADRRAGQMLREQGIDPASEMPRDEMPF